MFPDNKLYKCADSSVIRYRGFHEGLLKLLLYAGIQCYSHNSDCHTMWLRRNIVWHGAGALTSFSLYKPNPDGSEEGVHYLPVFILEDGPAIHSGVVLGAYFIVLTMLAIVDVHRP